MLLLLLYSIKYPDPHESENDQFLKLMGGYVYTPVIPAIQKAEAGGFQTGAQLRQLS